MLHRLVSGRKPGFTLIEVLLVVIVIAIIATFVIVRYQDARERAYVSAMLNDVRNFAIAQELHLQQYGTYITSVAEAQDLDVFHLSADVREDSLDVRSPTTAGFYFRVGHAKTDIECLIDYGEGRDNKPKCVDGSGEVTEPDEEEPAAANLPPIAAFDVLEDSTGGAFDPSFSPLTSFQLPERDSFPSRAELLFDASPSTDPDGRIVAYHWDLGDWTTAKGLRTWRRFTASGSYEITLTVYDDQGATGTATRIVDLIDEEGPVAAFTYTPATPVAGERITFDASATQRAPDNAPIVAYQWDLGDWRERSGQTTQASLEEGTYEVYLFVVDAKGRSSIAVDSIVVGPAPEVAGVVASWDFCGSFGSSQLTEPRQGWHGVFASGNSRPSWTTVPKVGVATKMAGNNSQYIDLPYSASTSTDSTTMVFEFSMPPMAPTDPSVPDQFKRPVVFGYFNMGSATSSTAIRVIGPGPDNPLQLTITNATSTVELPYRVDDGQPHTLALAFQPYQALVYLDGEYVGTLTHNVKIGRLRGMHELFEKVTWSGYLNPAATLHNFQVFEGTLSEAEIRAVHETVTTATCTIASQAETLTVAPSPVAVPVGGSVQLTARLEDGNGAEIGGPIDWESADASIATVNTSGRVTGVAEGTVVITARSGTLKAHAIVNVESDALPPDGLIAHWDFCGSFGTTTLLDPISGAHAVADVYNSLNPTWHRGPTRLGFRDLRVNGNNPKSGLRISNLSSDSRARTWGVRFSAEPRPQEDGKNTEIAEFQAFDGEIIISQGNNRNRLRIGPVADSQYVDLPTRLDDGAQHTLILAVEPNGLMRVYVDGTLRGSFFTSARLTTRPGQYWRVAQGPASLNGYLYAMAYYDEALADAEAARLHAALMAESCAEPVGIASLEVAPNPIRMPVGGVEQAEAIARDVNGNVIGAEVQWTIADTAIATVDSLGRVTGRSIGKTTVRAAVGGQIAEAIVQVAEGAMPPLALSSHWDFCSSYGTNQVLDPVGGRDITIPTSGLNRLSWADNPIRLINTDNSGRNYFLFDYKADPLVRAHSFVFRVQLPPMGQTLNVRLGAIGTIDFRIMTDEVPDGAALSIVIDGTEHVFPIAQRIDDDQVHTVAYVLDFDRRELSTYLDGVHVGTVAHTGSTYYLTAGQSMRWMGVWSSVARYMSLHGVATYTGALDEAAAMQAHVALSANPCPLSAIVPDSIVVTPNAVAITARGRAQLTARVYKDDQIIEDAPVRWESLDVDAFVNQSGLVTPLRDGGEVRIVASSGFLSDTATVTIQPWMPPNPRLVITPRPTFLLEGQGIQLYADGWGSNGQRFPTPGKVWSTSDTTIAIVNATGYVHAIGSGMVWVKVQWNELADSIQIAVSGENLNLPPTGHITYGNADSRVHQDYFWRPVNGDTLYFDASGSSDPDGTIEVVEWVIDGQMYRGPAATHTRVHHVFASAGMHEVRLVVEDDRGQRSPVVTELIEIYLDPHGPPEPVITATPNPQGKGLRVDFSAAGTRSTAPIIEYIWDFGDWSGTTTRESPDGAHHTYATEGTYTVELCVRDNRLNVGCVTDVVTILPYINTPPNASFTMTSPVVVNTPVTLTSTSTDAEGPITSYHWEVEVAPGVKFVDSKKIASMTFPEPGIYQVRHTVTDIDGAAATITMPLEVLPEMRVEVSPGNEWIGCPGIPYTYRFNARVFDKKTGQMLSEPVHWTAVGENISVQIDQFGRVTAFNKTSAGWSVTVAATTRTGARAYGKIRGGTCVPGV